MALAGTCELWVEVAGWPAMPGKDLKRELNEPSWIRLLGLTTETILECSRHGKEAESIGSALEWLVGDGMRTEIEEDERPRVMKIVADTIDGPLRRFLCDEGDEERRRGILGHVVVAAVAVLRTNRIEELLACPRRLAVAVGLWKCWTLSVKRDIWNDREIIKLCGREGVMTSLTDWAQQLLCRSLTWALLEDGQAEAARLMKLLRFVLSSLSLALKQSLHRTATEEEIVALVRFHVVLLALNPPCSCALIERLPPQFIEEIRAQEGGFGQQSLVRISSSEVRLDHLRRAGHLACEVIRKQFGANQISVEASRSLLLIQVASRTPQTLSRLQLALDSISEIPVNDLVASGWQQASQFGVPPLIDLLLAGLKRLCLAPDRVSEVRDLLVRHLFAEGVGPWLASEVLVFVSLTYPQTVSEKMNRTGGDIFC